MNQMEHLHVWPLVSLEQCAACLMWLERRWNGCCYLKWNLPQCTEPSIKSQGRSFMWFGLERREAAITQLKVYFIKPGGRLQMTAFVKWYSVHWEKETWTLNHNIRGIKRRWLGVSKSVKTLSSTSLFTASKYKAKSLMWAPPQNSTVHIGDCHTEKCWF